jgi:hypothetical protein
VPLNCKGDTPEPRLSSTIEIYQNMLIVFSGYDGRRRLNDLSFLDLGKEFPANIRNSIL